jgi:hypothetical protein
MNGEMISHTPARALPVSSPGKPRTPARPNKPSAATTRPMIRSFAVPRGPRVRNHGEMATHTPASALSTAPTCAIALRPVGRGGVLPGVDIRYGGASSSTIADDSIAYVCRHE